jgi:hypothetical protein
MGISKNFNFFETSIIFFYFFGTTGAHKIGALAANTTGMHLFWCAGGNPGPIACFLVVKIWPRK